MDWQLQDKELVWSMIMSLIFHGFSFYCIYWHEKNLCAMQGDKL